MTRRATKSGEELERRVANEYTYDVFISYSHADREWVRNELLPRLERVGLRVFIDYRDFEPGAPLTMEIERAVLQSRKTMLVLTPSYLTSEWTQLENILVQTLDPGAHRRRLLPVLRQPCELPLRIRSLVHVDFSPPQLWEVQFERLLKALGTDVATHPGTAEGEKIILPDTVLIPAGPFWMGSPPDDPQAYPNETPRREVNLREYRIGRYPVTNAQYACFVRETGHAPPKHWEEGQVPAGLEDHPVMSVNYEDAVAYCRWLSRATGQRCRLPTEAEWEKAARGGLPETRRYPWGDPWQPGFCNTRELGRNGTTSVHEFKQANRSPFGVVDMAGNVWEWTASWYERYPDSLHESLHHGQVYRVVRGGSWQNSHRKARISCRGRYQPDVRRTYLGFRIMLEISG